MSFYKGVAKKMTIIYKLNSKLIYVDSLAAISSKRSNVF